MHAEHIEAILADAPAGKMEKALRKKRELAIKRKFLTEKLEKIVRKIDRRKIEIGEDMESNNRSLTESENLREIEKLMEDLEAKFNESKEPITEIERKLNTAETQIQSLESLYAGNVEKN